MRIRTIVALDEDVLEHIKNFSQSRGISFTNALNSLLRVASSSPVIILDANDGRHTFAIGYSAALGSKKGLQY
jgi:hypothetical protein